MKKITNKIVYALLIPMVASVIISILLYYSFNIIGEFILLENIKGHADWGIAVRYIYLVIVFLLTANFIINGIIAYNKKLTNDEMK